MRVLSIGQLREGETCLERARILQALGWEVVLFDMLDYQPGGLIRRGLQHRLLDGPDIRQFNRDLLELVKKDRKFDLIWVDKGRWLFPEVLEQIKSMTDALAVHYTPDPAFTVHTSRHFIRALPIYDLCITTKRYELEAYKSAGAKKVVFNWQGIDERFSRIGECADISSDSRRGAVFVGHREAYYEQVMAKLAAANLDLRVWGPGWEGSPMPYVSGGAVMKDHYPLTLAKGKIGIGLLSKLCPDGFTTRTFEMPAAGLMLIAERTPEHEMLFKEGVEAEFFGSVDELIEKCGYYLDHDKERRRMARRGREKVVKNYTWGSVMRAAIDEIHDIIMAEIRIE